MKRLSGISGRYLLLALLIMPLCLGAATNKVEQLPASTRPATWANRIERPGLQNFYQVSPILYRGAQPTADGMAELERMGIKTIINLRGFHDDEEKLKSTKLSYVSIRFHTWHPEEEDMVKFLKIINDPARQPVFVHCKRGIDRTGTMVALYRVAVQGWTREEATREMTEGGFGYDGLFPNLVDYVKKLNVDRIKTEAGVATNHIQVRKN